MLYCSHKKAARIFPKNTENLKDKNETLYEYIVKIISLWTER